MMGPHWASGRGATELENLGHRGRAADISNGLSGQGRHVELPGGGMPGTSGNKDDDALYRHVLYTVFILEEGNIPHPRCILCNMLVPGPALNHSHPVISQCSRGSDQKRRRLAEEDLKESSERAFEAYMEPLEM